MVEFSEFKIGDRVTGNDGSVIFTGTVYSLPSNCVGTIRRDDKVGGSGTFISEDGIHGWAFSKKSDYSLKIISSGNYKNMNLSEKFALVFRAEPKKSFIKAGLTDANDVLTDEGSKIFLSWLLKKMGAEFKTEVVDPILAEEKE